MANPEIPAGTTRTIPAMGYHPSVSGASTIEWSISLGGTTVATIADPQGWGVSSPSPCSAPTTFEGTPHASQLTIAVPSNAEGGTYSAGLLRGDRIDPLPVGCYDWSDFDVVSPPPDPLPPGPGPGPCPG